MSNVEVEPKNPCANLEDLNVFKPPLKTIIELKTKGFIGEISPLWWSTNFESDPREFMEFSEFKKRLVHLGVHKVESINWSLSGQSGKERDVYLYPKPKVPMTILNLEVSERTLPFLVTARPYHKKEIPSSPHSTALLNNPSIKDLKRHLNSGQEIRLHDHFHPHIRGLFAGAKGNNIFWYPLRAASYWHEFGAKIQKALEGKKLQFIKLYEPPYRENRTYAGVWKELSTKKKMVSMNPVQVDFPYSQVSAEEFINGLKGEEELICFYPLRYPEVSETLPLVISTLTHKGSNRAMPAVLGIYAENNLAGYARKGGILRIRDLNLANFASREITRDFGIPVDAVLFTPQKGRPKYERVSSN